MVKNYMENVVDNWLPKVISKYDDICTCDKCLDDIKAIALNGLKPAYVSTHKGEVFTKVKELQSQFSTDAIRELTKAIEIVSKNVNHG